jgi:hypothetical protein
MFTITRCCCRCCCLLLLPAQRLVGYLAGDNEDSVKLPPTVPLNSVLLTADRASQTVKGHFFFAIYLPEEVQVGAAACYACY